MRRKYNIQACSICYDQAHRTLKGDPQTMCEHNNNEVRSFVIDIEMERSIWRRMFAGATPTIKIDMTGENFASQ